MAALKTKTEDNSNESLFADEIPKANNRNNIILERRRSRTRQSHAGKMRDGFKPLPTVHVMVTHASAASSKLKVELDSHADTCSW